MNRPKNKQGYFDNISYMCIMIKNPMKYEIKIPIELCFYVLRQKLLPAFKVYILLKMISSGKLKLDAWVKKCFSELCGYKTIRSLNNQLKKLLELDWIGFNKKSGIYHIRSFDSVQKKYSFYKRTGFWFAIQDMQCFDGVIYGSVIGYLSKNQGGKQRFDLEKGWSKQDLCKSPGFYPLANRALAKILNISISTASIMKLRAEEVESIEIMRKRIVEEATHDVYKRLEDTYPKEYLHPIIWKGRFYQRFPDLIKANLKYGTRKKIEQ